VPGATLTFPLGINNRGHVVGMFRDANEVGHGFLYKDGALTTIDHPLASSDSWPQDVNDRGQIVGFYERGRSAATVDAPSAMVHESAQLGGRRGARGNSDDAPVWAPGRRDWAYS
jgi:probable HAF family extracellular repeat protein